MKILKSKLAAWLAFLLIIVAVGATYTLRTQWWCFFDIFFAFMMVFSHLAALYLQKFSLAAAKMLDKVAFICFVLAILSFIGEYVALNA